MARPTRTYGRVPVDPEGNIIRTNLYGLMKWVEIGPDQSGQLDAIYITTLVQCLRLSLGESPFYANLGIPAQQSVVQQIYPDFYINRIQAYFAPFFASLIIHRQLMVVPPNERPVPTWRVIVVTHAGVTLDFPVVPI